jgi:hypothetical protein
MLSDGSKEAKYMLMMSRHLNTGQNHDIQIPNRASENVEQFIYLETTVPNQNSIQEEFKRRMNSGNASVGIMLSPSQVVPQCEEITTIYFFIQIFNV